MKFPTLKHRLPSPPSLSSFLPSSLSIHYTDLPSQTYLLGLRGLLTIPTFLSLFLTLFLPTAVPNTPTPTTGPLYATLLCKTLGVLLWNSSLTSSFIILLSARTLCLPFLLNPHRTVCASSIFRRGIRLWIPTFAAFSICAAAFSTTSTSYISQFLILTKNDTATTPLRFRNILIYFNALFDLFWITKNYGSQAAATAFPSGTLWIVSVLFQQSYTIYMTMVIIPYTRPSWRVKAFIVFILTAWWVQSWAWYSVTGLLLADVTLNMNFAAKARKGIRVRRFTIPIWTVYGVLVAGGVVLQYLFIAWRPEFRNKELEGHTGLYNSGGLNEGVDTEQPLARDDNYLVVLGVMLFVETYEGLQKALRSRVLVEMGRRSFSLFLMQPLIVYTAGIKLNMHLHGIGANHELATFVCFVVCVPLTVVAAEIFYRAVDIPSIIAAKKAWAWMKK